MLSWEDTLDAINKRELARLVRTKAQTEEYSAAKLLHAQEYGGTAEYLVKVRLGWEGDNLKSSGDPFLQNWNDIKILINDYSYDFEPQIRHFVVWLKMQIPCNADEFPTEGASRIIENFITAHFTQRCGVPKEDLIWFKNTPALQSIPSVSHFHVLVNRCTPQRERLILSNCHD